MPLRLGLAPHSKNTRLWEIDFARGIAILAMAGFHLLFDIHYILTRLPLSEFFWFISPKIIGGSFLFLVGFSMQLKSARANTVPTFSEYLKQGVTVFLWGMLITTFTALDGLPGTVLFGVLHCIGLSIILAYPFLNHQKLALPVGLVFVGVGLYIFDRDFGVPSWLFWTGLQSNDRVLTLDYYPILRWYGVVLLGIYLAGVLYPGGKRQWSGLPCEAPKMIRPLCYLGRVSLLFYLVHQPVFIGVIIFIRKFLN